jgi:hypothetical protein
LSDVGLVLLAQPVEFVKAAKLPQIGALSRDNQNDQSQFLVGYRVPEGVRTYRAVSRAEVFDDRWIRGGAGEGCDSVSGSIRFFGPIAESGEKRRTAVGTRSGFEGTDCATGRSGFARLDNPDVLS